MKSDVQRAIIQAAREEGIDPAFALAVAERESNFNPRARSSKTIRGIYQMRGDLRAQYGIGDTDDPYAQASGWGRFIKDVKSQMGRRLGRDVSDAEAYTGHHFGAGRAARMLRMAPDTPVDAVFTPREMSINPHFGRSGTVGTLNRTVMADIARRAKRHAPSTAATDDTPDFSQYGTLVETGGGRRDPQTMAQTTDDVPDFASFGSPVGAASSERADVPDFSQFGTPA